MTSFPVATGRIVMSYTVDSLPHTLHCYVRNPQLVGSDWMINSRATDANDTHWYDACHAFVTAVSNVLDAGATAGTHLLQTRSGGVWTTVDTTTQALTNAAGSPQQTTQASMCLRDVQFNRFRIQVMEWNQDTPFFTRDPNGGPAAVDAFTKEFTPSHSISTPPYTWLVSGWNQYLAASPFVSLAGTENRKLRRARGFA